jgi:hypothetical protein
MADWDRKYNLPTTVGLAYTVIISCPAGWRPRGLTRPNLTATRLGTKPNESYQIIYEKAGTSAKMDDVWKIGDLVHNPGNIRTPMVSIEHTSPPPPSSPISQDRPTIRDGL